MAPKMKSTEIQRGIGKQWPTILNGKPEKGGPFGTGLQLLRPRIS